MATKTTRGPAIERRVRRSPELVPVARDALPHTGADAPAPDELPHYRARHDPSVLAQEKLCRASSEAVSARYLGAAAGAQVDLDGVRRRHRQACCRPARPARAVPALPRRGSPLSRRQQDGQALNRGRAGAKKKSYVLSDLTPPALPGHRMRNILSKLPEEAIDDVRVNLRGWELPGFRSRTSSRYCGWAEAMLAASTRPARLAGITRRMGGSFSDSERRPSYRTGPGGSALERPLVDTWARGRNVTRLTWPAGQRGTLADQGGRRQVGVTVRESG